ncbi:MAG: hypothetical protein EBX63_09910, partial [Betaproteobacteria bacterium]|nr:hypothetical protein [Betaproteobacteria bacterium]
NTLQNSSTAPGLDIVRTDPVRERPKLQGALTAIGIFRLLRHWLFGLPLKSADRPRPDACQPSQKTKQGEPT